MKLMKRTSTLAAVVAALGGLAMMGPANAVPCGAFDTHGGIKVGATDLGISSASCKDGWGTTKNQQNNDSVGAMNAGNYFGISEWTELNKVPDASLNTSLWSFSPSLVDGQKNGSFTLADGIWSLYSSLAVVLKDGGSTLDKDIKWSAYLLPNGILGTYDWSYDNVKGISHITLYGVPGGTVTVPEPAALVVFIVALGGMTLVLRRRMASVRR